MSKQQTVGELNGSNSFWFRLSIRIIPAMFLMLISWGVWVTPQVILNTEQRERGPRFTPADAEKMKSEIKDWHHLDIEENNRELLARMEALK
jgi:hypothetical protein